MKRQNTYNTKLSEVKRKWYLVNAKGAILGRLATMVARTLIGKGKPTYTPHLDTGDYVIVINAKDIVVTGKKFHQKTYFYHSGYPGGDKMFNFKFMVGEHPERIIKQAVWGMLPQNRIGRVMLKKLKVFSNDKYKISQKTEEMKIK